MRRVILESPYRGHGNRLGRIVSRWLNVRYARRCVLDSLDRGESPVAFHLLHTQSGILDEDTPDHHSRGIAAGLEWCRSADATVVYVDRGISAGMKQGIRAAQRLGLPVEYRRLEPLVPVDFTDLNSLGVGA